MLVAGLCAYFLVAFGFLVGVTAAETSEWERPPRIRRALMALCWPIAVAYIVLVEALDRP